LPVLSRLQTQARANRRPNRLNRHEEHALDLRTVHSERINLARVAAVSKRPPRIRDAGLEADTAIPNVASLALDASLPSSSSARS